MSQVPSSDEPSYPSTDAAYEWAKSAYAIAEQRLEAVDRRVDALQSLATTLTIAVPAFVAIGEDGASDLVSIRLVVVGVVFAALTAMTLWARAGGELRVISPTALHEQYLHLPPDEFRRAMIYWSGEHLSENRRTIYWKSMRANTASVLLLVELLAMYWWLAGLLRSPRRQAAIANPDSRIR